MASGYPLHKETDIELYEVKAYSDSGQYAKNLCDGDGRQHEQGEEKNDPTYLNKMLNDEHREYEASNEITLAHIKYRDETKYGLTVLHLAIANEDTESVMKICRIVNDKMYKSEKEDDTEKGFFKCELVGEFDPLKQTYIARAVLTGNVSIIQCLIDCKADVYLENSLKDNILHSCVKHIEDTGCSDSSKRSLSFLQTRLKEKGRSDSETRELKMETLMERKNKENLTPLQLAYYLASPKAVAFLNYLSLKKTERNIGLSKIDSYRITEIDTITSRFFCDNLRNLKRKYVSGEESGLDLVFHNQTTRKKALETVQTKPMYYLIQEKWKKYWILITVFALIHFLIMILTTVYSVERLPYVHQGKDSNDSFQGDTLSGYTIDRERSSTLIMSIIIMIYDIISFILDLFLLISKFLLKPWKRIFLHNIDYVLLHIFFVSSLFLDFFLLMYLDLYEGYIIIVSLIAGWGFFTFFLRTFYNFGKLIDMIRHVLVKDVPRFLTIMVILLVAFSTSLHILIKKFRPEGHESVPETLYSMFMVTLGIREVDIYQTISSIAAAVLIMIYLILSHLILLNSLIAVMTTNSHSLSQNDEAHQTLHRLSVILFIEDMFLMLCYIKPVGELDTERWDEKPVYVLKLNDSSHS